MGSRDTALRKAQELSVEPGTLAAYIQHLVLEGFFDRPVRSKDVVEGVRSRFSRRFPVGYVQVYMKPFLEGGIVRSRSLGGSKGNLWYGAWLPEDQLGARAVAEKLRVSVDTAGWEPESAEDFQLALSCYAHELWKPAAVMVRRSYEGALISRYRKIEGSEPEKEGSCPKCHAKFGKRPLSLTDLHLWAAERGLVRQKMDGLTILLKDLGAGGAHPTKTRVMDSDTAEIIIKCGAVLLRELYRKARAARKKRMPIQLTASAYPTKAQN